MKSIFCILILFSSPLLAFSQALSPEYIEVKEQLCRLSSFKSITFHLPLGYKRATTTYQEGLFYDYKYPDSAYLVIHCGGLMQLPFLDEDEYVINAENKHTRKGVIKNTNLYWREENYTVINVYYVRATTEKAAAFDKVIEQIIKQINK